jgi:hypothetical protein
MNVNDEMWRIWKDVLTACFKAQDQHLPGEHKEPDYEAGLSIDGEDRSIWLTEF